MTILDPEACNTLMTKELKPAVKGHVEHGAFWRQIVWMTGSHFLPRKRRARAALLTKNGSHF